MTFRNASVLYGFMSVLLFLHALECAMADHQKTKLRSRTLDIPSDFSSVIQQEDNLADHLQEQKTKDRELSARIMGRTSAEVDEYPWYAISSWGGGCGASVIGPDILISAAHCLRYFEENVVLGINKLTDLQDMDPDKYPVESLHKHPQYNEQTFENDVMLIKLGVPVGNHIPFIPYNKDPLVPANGESATIIGFELEYPVTSDVIDLEEGKVDIVDHDTCDLSMLVDSVMICAGINSVGDSGGPLIREDGTLIGILSLEMFGKPSIYTRVSAVSDFIEWGLCKLSSYSPESCSELSGDENEATDDGKWSKPISSPTLSPSSTSSPSPELSVGNHNEGTDDDNMAVPFAPSTPTPSSTPSPSPVHAITESQSEYQVHAINHSMKTQPTCDTMCSLMSFSGYVVHKMDGSQCQEECAISYLNSWLMHGYACGACP